MPRSVPADQACAVPHGASGSARALDNHVGALPLQPRDDLSRDFPYGSEPSHGLRLGEGQGAVTSNQTPGFQP